MSEQRHRSQLDVATLTAVDFQAVDELMKRHRRTLGFLPKDALHDYISRRGVLGAKMRDGQLIGYLLYASHRDYFRITHLCVSDEFRRHGVATLLVDRLKAIATTQKTIRLRCRRDFPARFLWPKLGFVALGEKPGRSSAPSVLTLWCLTLVSDDQLGLFQATTSDETLDVVIDAQIFFSFDEPDSDNTMPSKALLSDFLIDSLNLWITDEMFNEIDRSDDQSKRESSRNRAHASSCVNPDPSLTEIYRRRLKAILPSGNPSQESDIRHLAKASASEIGTFVTRDRRLIRKADEIFSLTGMRVTSPTELIVKFHELNRTQSYTLDNISGIALRWQRITAVDLPSFPFADFLLSGEHKGGFQEKMESFLAMPDHYQYELLWSGRDIVAIRVLRVSSNDELTVIWARVARSKDSVLFGRFLIADTISRAVAGGAQIVTLDAECVRGFERDVSEMGFMKRRGEFVRMCLSCCLSRSAVAAMVAKTCPEISEEYRDLGDLEIERRSSPLCLEMEEQQYFLIPIRPGYAISLFDREQSSREMFGGDPSVLLRWGNVYYRTKSCQHMLKAPARILWYVSGDKGRVAAVSHLDDVVVDKPKRLFAKFKKFGILEWRDLYKMCGNDPEKEIMALSFSHTFPFRSPVSLQALRAVYREEEIGLGLQSPSRIPAATFRKIFCMGFPPQP